MAKKKEQAKPSKLVKILSKFNCQSYPLDETAIEVTLEDLDQIGITKCFDVDNNCVIEYDNSKDVRIKEIQEQIQDLKRQLAESDYRAIKYAEGYYSEEEYRVYRAERQLCRDEINQLEEELNDLTANNMELLKGSK